MVSGTVSGQGSDPGIEKQFDPGGVQLWGICSDRNTGGCRTFQDPLENKRVMEYISILPLMIPEIILGMVLMAFFYMLNLPFGMLTLLIGHTVFCVPYILMEVKARLVGMDPSLEEAARDLGAGSFRAFWDITLPLIMPAVISGSLLAFAMSMDDVVISIFVTGPRVSTLPIKVYTQMKTGVTPEINALCTIMLGVILLVLAVHLIAGKRGKGNIKDEQ